MKIRIPLSVLIVLLFLPAVASARVGHHRHAAVIRHSHAAKRLSVAHRRAREHDRAKVKVVKGWSSWYGPEMRVGHHYRKMANGQRFDPQKFTAASRTLPLGTVVRVENLKTGLAVNVKITDRGPFVRSRILDLAEAPARKIGCNGACPVLMAELETPQGISP